MTIVIVSGSLPDVHCGIGDYTARLANELARHQGASIVVVTSATDRIRLDAAEPARVVRAARWGLWNLGRLVRTIQACAPTVVHIQYPAVGYGRGLGIVLLPLALRWFCRRPVVLTIHERRDRGLAARLAIDFMALCSNLVIVLDQVEAAAIKRALKRLGPPVLTGGMISTIPVAAEVDRHDWRRRLGASDGDIVIVTFGLVHPRRHIEDIVDAVAELNASVKLWVVGGEAEYDLESARAYVKFLKERARSLDIDEIVRWMDHVSAHDVSACLQSADVAVLLYPDGASGRNTTLRAARDHGLPVVTTDGLATPESLRREAGLVFLPAGHYSPSNVAEAIIRAGKLRRAGQPGAGDELNMKAHVDFHLAAYRRLTPAAGSARESDALFNGRQS